MSSRAKPAHPHLTDQDMLDVSEVAELLRMPVSTVLDFARRDVIPGHKLGRRWIFLRDEVVASVREAPNRRRVGGAMQTPALAAATPARERRRRYPREAPSAGSANQRKLFG